MSMELKSREAISGSSKRATRTLEQYTNAPIARHTRVAIGAVAFIVLFAVWEYLPHSGTIPPKFLPPPETVFARLIELTHGDFAGQSLFAHSLASLQKFLSAYVLGIVVGVPVGLGMGLFRAFDHLLSPLVGVYRFIPPIAWVPFGILWFGTGRLAPLVVIFAGTFTPCVLNAQIGVRAIDPVIIQSARCLGVGKVRLFGEVLLPGALREIVAGMRLSAGTGWQSLVGAELVVGSTGLGYMIVQAEAGLKTSIVMSGMITIGALGAVMDIGIRYVERRLMIHR